MLGCWEAVQQAVAVVTLIKKAAVVSVLLLVPVPLGFCLLQFALEAALTLAFAWHYCLRMEGHAQQPLALSGLQSGTYHTPL